MVSKADLQAQLRNEQQQIMKGRLKDENPFDDSPAFRELCHACRVGDEKKAMEMINAGANLNARDAYDATPLILASLCGHYDLVVMLLEAGAMCERDTFQGER
jgi:ankyrin repeat protein